MARTTNISDLMKKKGRKKKGNGAGFDILGQGQVLVDAARKRKGAVDASDIEGVDFDPPPMENVVDPVQKKVTSKKDEITEVSASQIVEKVEKVPKIGATTKSAELKDKSETVDAESKVSIGIPSKMFAFSNDSLSLYRKLLSKISAERAFLYLMLRALGKDGLFSLSVPNIAAELSITDRSAQRLLKELMESGLVTLVSEFDRQLKTPRVFKLNI